MGLNFLTLGVLLSFASLGSADATSKIVEGVEVALEEFPSIVQVEFNQGKGWSLACGGVLLNDKVVLTTGQCMSSFQENQLRVLANDTHLGGGYARNVSQLIIHENYTVSDNGIPYYDVSLLVLDEPVVVSERTKPIEITLEEPGQKDNVSIAGWGTSAMDSPTLSETLQAANLSIVNRLVCRLIYNNIAHFANITEQYICARDLEGDKGACAGDAGGPVVSNGSLVGLISFSWGCADPTFPLVIVNISYFADWILEKLNELW